MKKVTFTSKLSLNKKTVSKLQTKEMDAVKGGRGQIADLEYTYPCTGTVVPVTAGCN